MALRPVANCDYVMHLNGPLCTHFIIAITSLPPSLTSVSPVPRVIGIPKNPEILGIVAEKVHSARAKYRESKVVGGG